MLESFRSLFKSKLGMGITLGFLALIALSFVSGDVANTGMFGGVAGGDRVANVGDEKVGTADLNRAANDALNRIKQNDPTLTMAYFVKQGGIERVLDEMIDRFALAGYADEYGIRAGDRLIDSEIAMIGAFRGANGKFDEKLYRQAIQQQGLSDKMVRDDLEKGLMARQLLIPATFGAAVSQQQVERYAVLLKERRKGEIAVLPSALYAPTAKPTDAQLSAYYSANRARYIRPERRLIRYATFGADAVADSRGPTDAEIAARFKRDAALYAAKESRSLSQVIAPTEAAARAIAAEAAGSSLEESARSKGLAVAKLASLDKSALSAQASTAVANAAFSAQSGALSAPARGSLGWYVFRVDSINRTPGRTLAQAREEIAGRLASELRQAALSDLTSRIEEEFDGGSSLTDIARELGVNVQSTRQITADGRVYGTAQETAPPILAKALSTAFTMDEGEPQLTEIETGVTFLIFDVAEITPSAPAPLAEIKADVAEAWSLSEGSKAAKAAADRVLGKVAKGVTLAAAMAAENKTLPRPDNVNFGLDDLRKMGQRPPAPVVLLFSMAEGTVKRLEAPDENGWFIVKLADIETGSLAKDDPVIAMTRSQLAGNVGNEYSDQLVKAIRKELGVTKNDAAIAAVRRQLTGGE